MECVYKNLSRYRYKCISAYEEVENPDDWSDCPNCALKPLIWTFDNGRSTGCGCGKDEYDHFSIHAESIMSHIKHSHNGASISDYDSDELRKNWNHWCETGEVLFEHASRRNDDRW